MVFRLLAHPIQERKQKKKISRRPSRIKISRDSYETLRRSSVFVVLFCFFLCPLEISEEG